MAGADAGQKPDLAEVGKVIAEGQEAPPPTINPSVDARGVALTIVAVVLGVAALRLAQAVLVPVAFAVLISYALDPIVVTLTRWRIPRGLGASLVLTLLVAGSGWLAYGMRGDVGDLAAKVPRVAEQIRTSLERVRRQPGPDGPVEQLQKAASTIESAATAAAEGPPAARGVMKVQIAEPPLKVSDLLVTGSMGLIGLGAQAVVVFFLALYLLASGDMFKRKLVRIAGPSLAKRKVTVQILNDIDRQIAAFLLIRIVVSAVVGIATWIPLRLLGLEEAALWGVVAGVLNIIPYIGPAVATVAISVVAYVQFGAWGPALVASGIALAVTTIEGYWLTPWLTSRAARMNAVAVFIGLLFWGWLWGLAGLLLSVPLIMVIKSVCDRVEDLKPIGELLGE
jgi:predicted PurR-regulated permease PerM